MDEKICFGQRLLELRKANQKSQAEIAQLLGITTSAYQNYENGRREAGYATIAKLADFYGVTTDYLLGREPEPDPLAMLNIKVNNQKFIDIYQELPEFQQQVLVDAMRKLSASAEEEYKKKKPRMQSETTLGAIEEQNELASEEEGSA